MRIKILLPLLATVCVFTASVATAATKATVTMSAFGQTKSGEAVQLYTLTNRNGLSADIMTYGGTVVRLMTPDRNGQLADINLGFDNVADYENKSPYFGCLVGRYGNRIADGKFSLDGADYTLAVNNADENVNAHLHGGDKGFDKVVWKAKPIIKDHDAGLILWHTSPDGDEGYPGTLQMKVTYLLTDNNELSIHYHATTDKATPLNLTNHMYFNLQGEGVGHINGHFLTLNADHYTPVTIGLIPTGEIAPVAGTPMDFTSPHTIGQRNTADHEQITFGGGYDHNWVLNKTYGEMSLAAEVYEPTTGRVMTVQTTEPGIQFYGGNFLEVDGVVRVGKSGVTYQHRTGFCLETQHYPDSPNQPNFPSTTLRPGETYDTTTVYQFSSR
ncbi:MAG: galactose mutarotase [Opitutaceae bacterium]|jgi:aldose 1-epimerase|nr:galactose mutarotase [Opitutaceae bacterium]